MTGAAICATHLDANHDRYWLPWTMMFTVTTFE